MKDPTILCPVCTCEAKKIRKQSGYRCISKGCPKEGELVVGELEVRDLKLKLVQDSRDELFAWARSCQKGGLKCLPSGPTSPARATDDDVMI